MSMTHERYVEKAKELFGENGLVEIDSDARVSHPSKETIAEAEDQYFEKGAYVQAWVWVPDDEEEVEP